MLLLWSQFLRGDARFAASFLGVCLVLTAPAIAVDPALAPAWQRPYDGDDSRGSAVIGHWSFDREDAAQDGGPLRLRGAIDGATVSEQGKFGRGLESFPGWPSSDQRHALRVDSHRALSPGGAFTLELWAQAKPELAKASTAYLIDKKYAGHDDYQWTLAAPDARGARRMLMHLGFGHESESFVSDPIPFPPGEWHHLAVSYDGAGTVRFYRDGSLIGTSSRPGRRGVAAGALPLSIGDRLGSHYGGFAGVLDEVRITAAALDFSPISLDLRSERSVWERFEPRPKIEVTARNRLSEALRAARLTISGIGAPPRSETLPELAAGAEHRFTVELDTALRPDEYALRVKVELAEPSSMVREETKLLRIVSRPLPGRMPVMMWGIGSPTEYERERRRLQELGFTHCLGFHPDVARAWQGDKPIDAGAVRASPTGQATLRMLDQALADQLGIAATIDPGHFLKQREELARVNREGKPYARRDVNAALPGLTDFAQRVGEEAGAAFADHPAFQAALINSEVRDDSEVSFSDLDRQAYRQFSGQEIPGEVVSKTGVSWKSIAGFPADRVVSEGHPILSFYRWFWTTGDGWNGIHTAAHRGLKEGLRTRRPAGFRDVWTWYDPAIRVPSIGGSGGEVDVLSQWTYTEPSPLRVGYFGDEVFAMAGESPQRPRVMKMTQLFWYRSTSAPKSDGAAPIRSPFDDHDPDAAYISIAPMHLRGAFWSMISRPVSGIMYHGWSSLVPTDGSHAYRYTQPDLQTEFRRLHREVLPPLAPTLLATSDQPTDVAYLNSFAAQVFAQRGSYGYSHDEAYLTLLHAQLQPRVIFDETVRREGLKQYKVLAMFDCDVLSAEVAREVREFQARGGIVIGDPNLAPAIKPDILVPRFARTKRTAEDQAAILANAAKLREALDQRYSRFVECSTPEIVVRARGGGESELVFAQSDRREFGNYVGQHGLVMEHGLPAQGVMTLRRADGFVYDLRESRPVDLERRDGTLAWPIHLGPCDGAVFLATRRAIERIDATGPAESKVGESCQISISIADRHGERVKAAIPLDIEITDPAGRPAEWSGYWATNDGELRLSLDLAKNDTPGMWRLRARELATGRVAVHDWRVRAAP